MAKEIKPELWIDYSYIYDQMIHEWQGKKYDFSSINKSIEYRSKLQKEWDKIERKVFDTMSEVSGLKWQKSIIDCYLVKRSIPFSSPLTIPIYRKDVDKEMNIQRQIEIVIHELVHNITGVQNYDKLKKIEYKKYGKLSVVTRIHILTHAILKLVMLELYGKKQTEEHIRTYDDSPDYVKAWEIVEKEGAKEIIKKCIKS